MPLQYTPPRSFACNVHAVLFTQAAALRDNPVCAMCPPAAPPGVGRRRGGVRAGQA